jgi:serine phosphatase RsbU (regulator of sigma subunit)
MSHLHGIFRSLADTDSSLDGMVEKANRIFSQSTYVGQFATLVAGRATRDGSVEFVSAGHPPLMHLRSSGVRSEAATAAPLGMSVLTLVSRAGVSASTLEMTCSSIPTD